MAQRGGTSGSLEVDQSLNRSGGLLLLERSGGRNR